MLLTTFNIYNKLEGCQKSDAVSVIVLIWNRQPPDNCKSDAYLNCAGGDTSRLTLLRAERASPSETSEAADQTKRRHKLKQLHFI